MKIKYLRLNKLERKQAEKNFFQTKNGMHVKKNLKISFRCSILCILLSIYILVDNYLKKDNVFTYIYGLIIFIFGIVLLILTRKVFIKKINAFITKK